MIFKWSDIKFALKNMDWVLMISVLMLVSVGVAFIYSAGFQGEHAIIRPFFQRQILWAMLGFTACSAAMIYDYRRLIRYVWGLYAMSIALLILVFFFGIRVHGSYRWLDILGVRLQPSELAKIATILTMACYLGRPDLDMAKPRYILTALFIVGLPFGLIAMQPDLGTAMVLVPVAVAMLVLAGVPWRYLAILAVIALMLLPVAWVGLDEYQRNRILVFWEPGRDPLGAGWNKIQSEIAVGSGGMSGKGFLRGTQNILGFLPRTVAPTDFIFSVVAEETGFIGSSGLIALYGVFLARASSIALVARDRVGQLLAAGMAAMLFTHVFINIAMTMGLMPITGLPLPLLSYGGSFMIGTMLAIGLIQSVYLRRYRH